MDIRLYVDRFLPTRTIERDLKREYGTDFFSVLDQGKDRIRGNYIDIEADPSILSDIQFFQRSFSVNDVELFEYVSGPLGLRVREDIEIPGTDILLEKGDLILVGKKEIKEDVVKDYEYKLYYDILDIAIDNPVYFVSSLKEFVMAFLKRARQADRSEVEKVLEITFDAIEKAEREAERYFR